MTGAWKIRFKGTKTQLTNRNQAMMETLSGRAGRLGATIGGVGKGAGSVWEGKPGGGGVAVEGMLVA